jgi:Rrf2 family iron-sulfur cluster assembly transcriptional regulator
VQLSTRGRYAVMAMVDMATRQTLGCECGPICLAEIAARQKLSQAYLEQLFGKLRRAGLVGSARGPGGGYRLADPCHPLQERQPRLHRGLRRRRTGSLPDA